MDEQNIEKKPGVPKKGLIIAGAVIGVLAAAYLGLCVWVGQSGTIFPRTSVAGVDGREVFGRRRLWKSL